MDRRTYSLHFSVLPSHTVERAISLSQGVCRDSQGPHYFCCALNEGSNVIGLLFNLPHSSCGVESNRLPSITCHVCGKISHSVAGLNHHHSLVSSPDPLYAASISDEIHHRYANSCSNFCPFSQECFGSKSDSMWYLHTPIIVGVDLQCAALRDGRVYM